MLDISLSHPQRYISVEPAILPKRHLKPQSVYGDISFSKNGKKFEDYHTDTSGPNPYYLESSYKSSLEKWF